MLDVNGVEFKPKQKIKSLEHADIYECTKGYRCVVKRDTRNQAIIILEKECEKSGLTPRKFGKSIGIPMSTYERWSKQGKVPNNDVAIKTIMNTLNVSKDEAIKLIEE